MLVFLSLKIRLQETFCQLLNCGIRSHPTSQSSIIFQLPISCWEVSCLQNKLHRDAASGVTGYGEPDRITSALARQAMARFCVSQIAGLKLLIIQQALLVPRSPAESSPRGAKRQAPGMRKRDVVRAVSWTEKWTGQTRLLETDGTIVLIADKEHSNFSFEAIVIRTGMIPATDCHQFA